MGNIILGLSGSSFQGDELVFLWLEASMLAPLATRLLLELGFAWDELSDELYPKSLCPSGSL